MVEEEQIRKVLENSEMFAGMPKAAMEELVSSVRPVKMEKGKLLFRKGDLANGCFSVLEGVLKVAIEDKETKDETLLAIIGQGDIVGEMALVDRKPRSASVTVLKDSILGHLSQTDFYRLADSNTEVYRHLLRFMSLRLRNANARLEEEQKPLGIRLALLLLRLADAFGEVLPDGRILIRYKVSQVQMARMIGVARENINRQLSSWRREKMISRISSYYCLEDRLALEDYIESFEEQNW